MNTADKISASSAVKMWRAITVSVFISGSVGFLFPQDIQASMYMPLFYSIAESELIVKARTVAQLENYWAFEVIEEWKGKYDQDKFARTTPEGYFIARDRYAGVVVNIGQEIVFFFSTQDQPEYFFEGEPTDGKISVPLRAFPITQGRLHLPAGQWKTKEYSVEKLKEIITSLAAHAGGAKLHACRDRVTSVKAAKTRGQLEQHAKHDGGIAPILKGERYVVCPCGNDNVWKVTVWFRPDAISDEDYDDPNRFNAWMDNNREGMSLRQDDVVIRVSHPYCELSYGD